MPLFKVAINGDDLITGQQYTLSIRMIDTGRYDYLLQSCTYNDKYRFVDQNSCLVCDKFFLQMWESDMYRLHGATKRTFIHFMPPEPLTRLECSVRILHCCGCAERACERKILPTLITYPQQVVNLAITNNQAVLATSVASWPWWIWLLIVLGLILLLCLLPLLLLLCSQLRMRRRKASDSKAIIPRSTPATAPNILVREKEMEANGASGRRSVLPPPSTHIIRTPSDSPSESVHSTASQSRAAVVIRQQQPCTSWADRSIRNKIESRSMSDRHMGTRHLENAIDKHGDLGKYGEATVSGSKFPFSRDEHYIGHGGHEEIVHQQTTCEEKFFKKSDHQNRMLEEGYDRAQLTYTIPKRHFSRSEIV
uniref:ZP domain-containing protein n=1 Tax=Elaeophora elaphi TaxID=1147741 RepID=A0A0R3S2C0_9BILA